MASFHKAAGRHGFPASVLTDNGAVFTAAYRGEGRCAIELELAELGIHYSHSSPYHPQTCGKVERFHQKVTYQPEDHAADLELTLVDGDPLDQTSHGLAEVWSVPPGGVGPDLRRLVRLRERLRLRLKR